MLEFRAERYAQAVIDQAYFVLHECAEMIQRSLIWLKGNGEAGVVPVSDRPVTKSPHKLLRIANVESMLEIHIEYVLMVHEQRVVRYRRIVVVHLQRHRRTLGAVIPPPQKVSSAVLSIVGEGARIGCV